MKKVSYNSTLENELQKELDLHGLWCDTLKEEIPRRWTIHGDLVLLPENCFQSSVWMEVLGSKLWDVVAEVFQKSKVAKQGSIKSNTYRQPSVTLLRGENGWVEHVDNKIRYRFNVITNMFSRGNITEKLRVANMDCKGQVVVDLFAGIGYFTLPFLVHAGAAHVHACDCNPDAIEALKINLAVNGVQKQCTVYEGDCAQIAPHGVADRVYLGLIPSSRVGWQVACQALKQVTGGILHIHHNVTTKPTSDNLANNQQYSAKELKVSLRNEFGETLSNELKEIFDELYETPWTTELLHVEFVKQYAPHVDHIVVDVLCRPVQSHS